MCIPSQGDFSSQSAGVCQGSRVLYGEEHGLRVRVPGTHHVTLEESVDFSAPQSSICRLEVMAANPGSARNDAVSWQR